MSRLLNLPWKEDSTFSVNSGPDPRNYLGKQVVVSHLVWSFKGTLKTSRDNFGRDNLIVDCGRYDLNFFDFTHWSLL